MLEIGRAAEDAGLDSVWTFEVWETLRDGYLYQQRKYQEWAEGEEVDELLEKQKRELEERARRHSRGRR